MILDRFAGIWRAGSGGGSAGVELGREISFWAMMTGVARLISDGWLAGR